MMKKSLRRVYRLAAVPCGLILAGILLVRYVVENPTDLYVERMLTYPLIIDSLRQHLVLVFVSMAAAIVVGILAGIMLTRPRLYYVGRAIENIINIGQTVPSLAVLALMFSILGLGFKTAIFALWIYSILSILRNTQAGINSVPAGVLESARGMGMHPLRVLLKIEFPLAAPIIIAGIRTAIVINVGTATLATFIGAGGLGDLIVSGMSVRRDMVIFTGAALSALMAIFFDNLIGQIERSIVKWT